LESFNFSWVVWIKNVHGFSLRNDRGLQHKWLLTCCIVYRKLHHTPSACARLYRERSSNPRFFTNVCEKQNQLILIHFDLFTYKYPPPSPSSLHFRPFRSVNPWLRVRECFGWVLEKENELSWFISSREVISLT